MYLNGGRTSTTTRVEDWVKQATELGAGEILLTSINNDGTKEGFALGLTARISELTNVPIIASGGAGTMQHFEDVFKIGKADAALAAGIFHNKEVGIMPLKQFLKTKDVNVRI